MDLRVFHRPALRSRRRPRRSAEALRWCARFLAEAAYGLYDPVRVLASASMRISNFCLGELRWWRCSACFSHTYTGNTRIQFFACGCGFLHDLQAVPNGKNSHQRRPCSARRCPKRTDFHLHTVSDCEFGLLVIISSLRHVSH